VISVCPQCQCCGLFLIACRTSVVGSRFGPKKIWVWRPQRKVGDHQGLGVTHHTEISEQMNCIVKMKMPNLFYLNVKSCQSRSKGMEIYRNNNRRLCAWVTARMFRCDRLVYQYARYKIMCPDRNPPNKRLTHLRCVICTIDIDILELAFLFVLFMVL